MSLKSVCVFPFFLSAGVLLAAAGSARSATGSDSAALVGRLDLEQFKATIKN